MGRFLRAFALFLCCALLAACTGAPPVPPVQAPSVIGQEATGTGGQVAFVATEAQHKSAEGTALWKSVSLFGNEEGVSCVAYTVTEEGAEATLEIAIKGGAQVVVVLGEEMAALAEKERPKYKNTYFITVEGGTAGTPAGTIASLRLAAEQAGWLAGYAAVQNGARHLAYLQPPAEENEAGRYALGYVLGAADAARGLKLAPGEVSLLPIAPAEGTARGWQQAVAAAAAEGAQTIFVTNPALYSATLRGVRGTGCTLLALYPQGQDAPAPDDALLAALPVGRHEALHSLLAGWHRGSFGGGRAYLAGVNSGDIGIDMSGASFTAFAPAAYEAALARFTAAFEVQLAQTTAPGEEGALPTPQDMAGGQVVLPPQSAPGSAPPTTAESLFTRLPT